jgi:hypothetical protein
MEAIDLGAAVARIDRDVRPGPAGGEAKPPGATDPSSHARDEAAKIAICRSRVVVAVEIAPGTKGVGPEGDARAVVGRSVALEHLGVVQGVVRPMALGFASNKILGLIRHDKLAEGWPT